MTNVIARSRVTWSVTPWAERYRGQIYVDLYPVEKSYHDSYREAERWCKQTAQRYREEVREEAR